MSNRAIWRSKTDGPPIALALRRVRSPPVSHPFVARGAAHGGRGVAHGDGCADLAAVASHVSPWRSAGVPVASCASASNGSNADDSVKPNAAPSPSKESAFRREIISGLILSFTSCLPSLAIAELDGGKLNAITGMKL